MTFQVLRNLRSLVLVKLISKFAFRSEVLVCSSQHTRLFCLFYEVFRVHDNVVETRRIELLTPCLQGRCSPSWATPPYWLHLLPGFLDSVDECWPFQMSFHCDAYFSFVRLIRSPGIRKNMVGLTRLELVTSRLSGVRSNQLSYRPILDCEGKTLKTKYWCWQMCVDERFGSKTVVPIDSP